MSLLILFGPAGTPGAPSAGEAIAYILNGTTIQPPHAFSEENGTLLAENQVLEGDVNRDFYGLNKRRWILVYRNLNKLDYDLIKAVYDTYLSGKQTVTWEVTGDNYTVGATDVHIDLPKRDIMGGTHYLSTFELTLTEA